MATPVVEKPPAAEQPKKVEGPRVTTTRTKTTTNLLDALNGGSKPKDTKPEEKPTQASGSEAPVHLSDLKKAWSAYTEQSKNNMSHYHLLNREFEFNGTLISLPLTNPIEEPLLDTIKAQLITFLREQLGNNTISVVGIMKEMSSKKVAYTNKEKFDHLAEKNPMLLELRDRLGLDVDF